MAELDIAAFLRARLDEREARALAAILRPDAYRPDTEPPGRWDAYIEGGDDGWAFEGYGEVGGIVGDQEVAEHIADNDPAFVLADVAAKRRLIAGHGPGRVVDESDGRWASDPDSWDPPWTKCTGHEWASYPCELLRLLALPYAGHPDYREDWKP